MDSRLRGNDEEIMTKQELVIGYLYSDLMNIYGDTGNIICLTKRCEWRGIEVVVKKISVGDELKKGECDLFFFGGGQDQAQNEVAADLGKSIKGKVLREELERGVPMLSICGGYQLLGDYYEPLQGPKLEGLGFLPVFTKASNERMIGNIVIRLQGAGGSKEKESATSNLPPETSLVGFENHSGKTYLKQGAKPLGTVIKGFGNNGEDQAEGCIYKNTIGCYMHGSLLPKNPELADWLIQKALEVKYSKEIKVEPFSDELESKAHSFAIEKFS